MPVAAVCAMEMAMADEKDLLDLAAPAWRTAVRALGRREGAEDVVQEALLAAVRQLRASPPPEDLRTWFLRVVGNVAKNHLRTEARRQRREAAVAGEIGSEIRTGEDTELTEALRRAMDSLDAKHRLPVALCYEEGLSHREAAAVLEVPRRTLSLHVGEGLEELRKLLARAGYAAAPAAVMAGLSHTAPAVPAGLSAVLEKLVANGAGAVPRSAPETGAARLGGQASAALNGGLIMKIVLGIAAAGLVAGSAFWAAGSLPHPSPTGRGSEGEGAAGPKAAAPAEKTVGKTSGFATPCTDPEAQWVKAPNAELRQRLRPPDAPAGSSADGMGCPGGELDGPAGSQFMYRNSILPCGLQGVLSTGGRYVVISYDRATERCHGLTAGAAGLLDGPFSRARFHTTDYTPRGNMSERPSPDGRYLYLVDGNYGAARLRCLDYESRTVSSLPTGSKSPMGVLSVDGQGRVYTVNYAKELVILDPADKWQKPRIVKLQMDEKANESFRGVSNSIAVDEIHGRLYACTNRKWYLWYWDLKDGSFHGVIAYPARGEGRPGGQHGAAPGPFKGTRFYGEGSLDWGPDDPQKRFLYMAQCDDRSFYRLDLEKEIVSALDLKSGRFVDDGPPRRPNVLYMLTPTWLPDGSFFTKYPRGGQYYKRVK